MTLLGITFSNTDVLREWRDKVGLASDLLQDADRAVAMAYGAADSPQQEKAGRVSVLIDEQGTVAKVYRPKDVSAHPSEVLHDIGAH